MSNWAWIPGLSWNSHLDLAITNEWHEKSKKNFEEAVNNTAVSLGYWAKIIKDDSKKEINELLWK